MVGIFLYIITKLSFNLTLNLLTKISNYIEVFEFPRIRAFTAKGPHNQKKESFV